MCVNKGEETKRFTHIAEGGTKCYYFFIGMDSYGLLQFKDTKHGCVSYWNKEQTKERFKLTDSQIEELLKKEV
ncbi:MAG: hypothetical protein LIP01_08915 [Tannerellaceae bacterium]|nr:hypothetical protein [Tannerellaceae bacterium]